MITWLEDPSKYAYLRRTRYIGGPVFPVKGIGRKTGEFGRLVGYRRIGRLMPYTFEFEFYWLKKHDRDLSPDDVYAGPPVFGGAMPSEAVDPRALVGDGSGPTPWPRPPHFTRGSPPQLRCPGE